MTTKTKLPVDPITPGQAAAAHGVNRSRIHKLLDEGRIPGAVQLENGQWMLPKAFTITPPARRARKLEKLA